MRPPGGRSGSRTRRTVSCVLLLDGTQTHLARGVVTCDPPEDGTGGEPRATGIVAVEEPTDHLAGGVEAADGCPGRVEHPGVPVNVDSAEGERDPAGDRVPVERRGIERLRPVRLRRVDEGRPTILDRGVEGDVHDGGVEVVDRAPEPVDIDPEPIGEWV